MKRCLQLAKNGLGTTYPNPMVGCVIVHKNKIIGEGWHRKAGEPHAEVNAVHSVAKKNLLKEASLYVSLEPCSHYGKTPPCSSLIISQGIKKVVVGCIDPFAEVAGRGIQQLMNAGCQVNLGVLEKECRALNKRFFTFHQKKRPFIILKWAQSEDGFLAPKEKLQRAPVFISNAYSKQEVHHWRTQEQAILVGTETALADNPKLSARLWEGNNPLRLVLDRNLRIPQNSAVLDGSIPTLIFTEKKTAGSNPPYLTFEQLDFSGNIATQIAAVLYKKQIQSVIIEGGAKTLQTFINAGLWDEARIFTAGLQLKEGIKIPQFQGNLKESLAIGDDLLKIYRHD